MGLLGGIARCLLSHLPISLSIARDTFGDFDFPLFFGDLTLGDTDVACRLDGLTSSLAFGECRVSRRGCRTELFQFRFLGLRGRAPPLDEA